jgi:hypothetical protein
MSNGGEKFEMKSVSELKKLSVSDLADELQKITNYIDVLVKEAETRQVIKSKKGLPNEEEPLRFKVTDKSYVGFYIASEEMFFIGFEESGDFKWQWEVTDWEYLKETDKDFPKHLQENS